MTHPCPLFSPPLLWVSLLIYAWWFFCVSMLLNDILMIFTFVKCWTIKQCSAKPSFSNNWSPFFFFFSTVARFSPDDKFSRQRVLLKKRFGLLPTQKPAPKYWALWWHVDRSILTTGSFSRSCQIVWKCFPFSSCQTVSVSGSCEMLVLKSNQVSEISV